MMAEQIRKSYTYNTWAWNRLFASVEKLDTTAYAAKRPLFFHNFDSIHAVLVHCMSTEQRWLSRCLDQSADNVLATNDYADFTAVRARWATIRDDWTNFLRGLDDEGTRRLVTYRGRRNQSRSVPMVDVVQHVVTDAVQHRSQIVPVLYHLGMPVPPLDYMEFRSG